MRKRSLGVVVASLLGFVPALVFAVATPAGTASAVSPTSAYLPLPTAARLIDTRTSGALAAGGTINVVVTGDAPMPPRGSATAVVLNITVVGPSGIGYWTAYPHGTPPPLAASLYVDERAAAFGATLAMPNLVTVPVGSDGTIDIFSQSGGHVVVDMLGAYVVSEATAAGRVQPLGAPQRILDTRTLLMMQPNTSLTVPVPGANGASAAVLTVTTIGLNPGYWTVYPNGVPSPPLAANLNSLFPQHTVANQVIVPLDGAGNFNVFSQSGGHLIVDLVALVTGPTAPVSTDGLFVALDAPTRFLDTRDPAVNPLGGAQMPLPAWSFEVPVTTNAAVGRTDVAAVAMNVTVTDALAGGYVTLSPAGANDSAIKSRTTATVSIARAGQTLPSHAIVAVSPRGFDVFALSGGHVIADVAGYYLGIAAPAPYTPPVNVNPTPAGCLGFPIAPVSAVVTGSSRTVVARLQQRLLDLGFWVAGPDGQYGLTTSQAVMAFQKWSGLPATTVVDEATAVRINSTLCRPSPGAGATGDLIEVDKGKQLLFIVRGGRALWVLNTSTGGNYNYSWRDDAGNVHQDRAVTPSGNYNVYRVHDQVRYESTLGILYRPRFVVGGIAVHGYSNVPNYPASHGCIRVSNPAMDMIWGQNLMPMRSRVWLHD